VATEQELLIDCSVDFLGLNPVREWLPVLMVMPYYFKLFLYLIPGIGLKTCFFYQVSIDLLINVYLLL
jgi:hypothetical protein